MSARIVVMDGHPDPDPARFCHAIAASYADGARTAGRAVRTVDVASLEFELLRSEAAFNTGAPPAAIAEVQDAIAWSDHLVLVYPLWLGAMPALLKGCLEQTFRPGFALPQAAEKRLPWSGKLAGRSARVIVTMGMPAFVYRWFYLAHSVKSLERNVLRFCGIGPIGETLIGGIGTLDAAALHRHLASVRALGERGQ